MRIGLVSDSHANLRNLKFAVEQMGVVDAILHMGDCYDDAMIMKQWVNVPVYAVLGNMDSFGNSGEIEIITEIGGKRFYICHGHRLHVKSSYRDIYYRARELEAEVVCFGHTHHAMIEDDGKIFMMNPGSVSLPYAGQEKSFGIIEIDNERVKGEIFSISF